MQTHKLTMQTHKLKSAFRHLALVCALTLAVNASAEVASLTYRTFSLANGALTAEVVSPVGGTLVLLSGTRDCQADYAKWDRRISLGAISADEPKAVAATIPAGHTYARLCVATCQYPVYDYLEGDGQAYLELDYTLSSADQVEVTAMPLALAQSGVFGCRSSVGEKNFTLLRIIENSAGKFALDVNAAAGSTNYKNYRLMANWANYGKYTFIASAKERKVIYADGTSTVNTTEETAEFTTTDSCRLFDAVGRPGSYQPAFKGRIYSFTISTLATGEVQRDLVAINMGTDDAPRPAMYDVKTGKTYENVSETDGAAFTLGAKTGEVAGVVALGLCVVTDVTPGSDVQSGHCLTLPVGLAVGGVDSSATFSTLGVTNAYTYAFSVKNPRAQMSSDDKRYYGHIMGAGASNTKQGNQKGAPLLYETNNSTGERFIEIQTWTSAGKVQCLTVLGYSTANTSWTADKVDKLAEIAALEDGEWHDVVVTYDATAQHAQVFVDGFLKHDITSDNLAEYLNYSDLGNTAFATPGNNCAFGVGRNYAKTDSFAGSLANVSVWNRALTAAEAVAISGERLVGNETGLVLYWPLDGETGDATAYDQQENIDKHNGTVYSSGDTECGTYWEGMGPWMPRIVATMTGANGVEGEGPYSCTLDVDKPVSGWTETWYKNGIDVGATKPSYNKVGCYTNIVKVTADGYKDFYGTGVVTVVVAGLDEVTYSDELIATSVPLTDFEVFPVDDGTAYVFKNTAEGKLVAMRSISLEQLLLVGGGGAGGTTIGGGGGGGEVKEINCASLGTLENRALVSFTVGAGGLPVDSGTAWNLPGGNGGTTTVTIGDDAYSALGGGGGGSFYSADGVAGASGGGGAGGYEGPAGVGGLGSAGSAGGNGSIGNSWDSRGSAGGGGAGGKGGDGASGQSGKGGDGVELNLTGTPVVYGAGGGGGGGNKVSPGVGGINAGAGGQKSGAVTSGGDGVDGTGAGGGGGGYNNTAASHLGGKGGDGVIVFVLKKAKKGLAIMFQ